eukprot:CAMPEP_0117532284 /NCGR_PEP_ID=MMETSP0784-20121206/39288_1 /TAXON_ID=39447 /ORGANISM="" /LENGTH=373 /DNA_ID=CAMNT_0005328671 /DNA_START=66 /DNA_END=1184 /DNA_ORIENTATION=-
MVAEPPHRRHRRDRHVVYRSSAIAAFVVASLVPDSAAMLTGDEPEAAQFAAEGGVPRIAGSQLQLVTRSPGRLRLQPKQLDTIYSVECLEFKQRHGANADCFGRQTNISADGGDHAPRISEAAPLLGIGTYPSWQDSRCRSDNEFFCDPEAIMSDSARQDVTRELQKMREQALVGCGQLDTRLGGTDETHYRHFNLGVAIAGDWPSSEADPMTLQRFGMVLMARWGLMPWYNGVDLGNSVKEVSSWEQYTTNCPNFAMFILLPTYRKAFVSAPSCEFICKERGGPEIVDAALAALGDGGSEGVAAALKAAIDTTRNFLERTSPLSLERQEATGGRKAQLRTWTSAAWRSERLWTMGQRFVFAALALSFVFGLA